MKHSYFQYLEKIVHPGAKVLDLGCGTGELLETLFTKKGVKGYGIDINFENILACVKRGIPVYQGDIDEGLKGFSSQSYDYVILSQTIQQVHKPSFVLSEMLRVGKKGIIIFPNFAHWRIRLHLLQGRAPRTSTLPYNWYNTPNIRVITIQDFKRLCQKENIEIVSEITDKDTFFPQFVVNSFSNLFSRNGFFVIQLKKG